MSDAMTDIDAALERLEQYVRYGEQGGSTALIPWQLIKTLLDAYKELGEAVGVER